MSNAVPRQFKVGTSADDACSPRRPDVAAPQPFGTFSHAETLGIREMVATPGAQLRCPRCGGELTSDMPLAGGHSIAAVWEFRCDACRRTLLVRDLPGL